MRILVTGCNGQLGNEMQLLAKENAQHEYFFTDVIIPEGTNAQKLDITNEQEVEAFVDSNNIDCIVNCAAFTAVDKAESEEEFCNLLNNIAPGYLAKAVGKRGGSMVQVSTDYVFDGTSHKPVTEEQPTCPNSVYGRTKLAGELAITASGCRNILTNDEAPQGEVQINLQSGKISGGKASGNGGNINLTSRATMTISGGEPRLPERPRRCSRDDTVCGAQDCTTRSRRPMSMPSSNVTVAPVTIFSSSFHIISSVVSFSIFPIFETSRLTATFAVSKSRFRLK